MTDNLLNVLTERDYEIFDCLRQNYIFNGNEKHSAVSSRKILTPWAEAKKELFKILGNQLTYKKYIDVNLSKKDYEKQFDFFYTSFFTYNLAEYYRFGSPVGDLIENVISLEELAANRLQKDLVVYSDGEKIIFTKGIKLMRVFHKLAKKANLLNDYENFRIKHSTFAQRKHAAGTLTFSIHPIDFLTMSDNNYNWTTCMSVVSKEGEYRIGTIEMMNSPCVIEAYLEGSVPYSVNGYSLPNKKWRCLFVVTPYFITPIRSYPYQNYALEWEALKDLVDMVENYYGVFIPVDFKRDYCYLTQNKKLAFICNTNLMYNDTIDHTPETYAVKADIFYDNSLNWIKDVKESYIQFSTKSNGISFLECQYSGMTECMNCGEKIIFITEHDYMTCDECRQEWECCSCGRYINHLEEVFWDDDNLSYCENCAKTEIVTTISDAKHAIINCYQVVPIPRISLLDDVVNILPYKTVVPVFKPQSTLPVLYLRQCWWDSKEITDQTFINFLNESNNCINIQNPSLNNFAHSIDYIENSEYKIDNKIEYFLGCRNSTVFVTLDCLTEEGKEKLFQQINPIDFNDTNYKELISSSVFYW